MQGFLTLQNHLCKITHCILPESEKSQIDHLSSMYTNNLWALSYLCHISKPWNPVCVHQCNEYNVHCISHLLCHKCTSHECRNHKITLQMKRKHWWNCKNRNKKQNWASQHYLISLNWENWFRRLCWFGYTTKKQIIAECGGTNVAGNAPMHSLTGP